MPRQQIQNTLRVFHDPKSYQSTDNSFRSLSMARQDLAGIKQSLTKTTQNIPLEFVARKTRLQQHVEQLELRLDVDFVPYSEAKRIIEQQTVSREAVKGKNAFKNASERRRRKKKKAAEQTGDTPVSKED